MRDPIDIAFRAALIVVAVAVLLVTAHAATMATVHPATAAAIAVLCVFVSIDAWRGR